MMLRLNSVSDAVRLEVQATDLHIDRHLPHLLKCRKFRKRDLFQPKTLCPEFTLNA